MSSRSIKAASAFVEVSMNDDKLQQGIKRMQGRLRAMAAGVGQIGAKFLAVGVGIGSAFLIPIRAASTMQEVMNKFNVVFGENSAAVKEWGDNFAKEVGRSKRQVASFLADTQDLLVPAGVDPDAAEEMSKILTGLAVDVASFNNKLDSDVLRDFHSALTGGGETVKKYGVILNVATTNAKLLEQGIDPKGATNAQKTFARLTVLVDGTTSAQGDAIRSGESWENIQKRIAASSENMSEVIGRAVLPALESVGAIIAEYIPLISEWIEQNTGLVKVVAALAAGITFLGAALVVSASAAYAFSAAMAVATLATKAFRVALLLLSRHPLAAMATAVAALALALVDLEAVGKRVSSFLQSSWAHLSSIFRKPLVDFQAFFDGSIDADKLKARIDHELNASLKAIHEPAKVDGETAALSAESSALAKQLSDEMMKAAEAVTSNSETNNPLSDKMNALIESMKSGKTTEQISDASRPKFHGSSRTRDSEDLRSVSGFKTIVDLFNGGSIATKQLEVQKMIARNTGNMDDKLAQATTEGWVIG